MVLSLPSRDSADNNGPVSMAPPDGLPRYRLLTGPDDATFCARVSEALDLGYQLAGAPVLSFDGERVVAAQAVLWPHEIVEGGGGNLRSTLDLLYEKQLEVLQPVRRSVADVATARKRLELQVTQLEKATEKRADEAEAAAASGDENLARSARSARAEIGQLIADLKSQRDAVARQEQWLISLSRDLQTQIEHFRTAKELLKSSDVATQAVASVAEASVTAMLGSLVADELRKLAGMRDAGVLTQEEFDSQKTKLLSQS